MSILYTLGVVALTIFADRASSRIASCVSDYKRLYNALEFKYDGNRFRTILLTLEILKDLTYLKMIQYLNGHVTQVDKYTYMIRYTVNGRLHSLLVKPPRGPQSMLVYDSSSDDGEEVEDNRDNETPEE
jgi:hypothetical protein